MTLYFCIIVTAFIVAYLVTPEIRYIALRTSAIDRKNHRKIHTKVIAQLGGLAVYFGMCAGLMIVAIFDPAFFRENFQCILGFGVCSTLILLLGMYDDFQGSGALLKFFVQIVIAVIFIKTGFRLERIFISGLVDINLGLFSGPLTVLWLVGIINAVNLIDGLDGLATGVIGIAASFFFIYGILFGEKFVIFTSLALLGSTLAFLKYNFHPAKIFLGDTGSLFLGFVVGGLSICNSGSKNLINPFFIPAAVLLLLPITDTVLAIIRRMARRQHIFRGDASHLHHYYIKRGFSQMQVTVTMYAITFSLGIASLLILHRCNFLK